MKSAKNICSLWCVYPKGRSVVDNAGHLRRAFCFIPKYQHYDYQDIVRLQRAIIYIMQASTQGDLFTGIVEDVYDVLQLLADTLPTDQQAMMCNKVMFPNIV